VLGVHCIGENATEIVHVGQLTMDMGLDITYFTETVFNYPTFAEAYRSAAFNGIKRLGFYRAKAAQAAVAPPAPAVAAK
jgi:NAD(P) transhydrogenase